MGWLEKLESKPSQPCLVQVNYPGAHNSDELKNKLFRVGGWLGGGLVGEAGNKTNSALLSWGLAELGNNNCKVDDNYSLGLKTIHNNRHFVFDDNYEYTCALEST